MFSLCGGRGIASRPYAPSWSLWLTKECDVLVRLARDVGKVTGHRDLLVSVWGAAHAGDSQYLRVVIGQLRQKLEADPSHPALIITEPAIGYRLEA
jgi:two-component system KDP operon response regulator KdpE